MTRVVSWFSGGIPSAVATKLALTANQLPGGCNEIVIVNCEIKEEHPDNKRFLADCEEWFGQEIIRLGNDDYHRSVDEVIRKTRYLVGPRGARCTGELKKALRWSFGRPDDVIVMGYTAEEQRRVDRLLASEPLLQFWPILIDRGLTRQDVMAVFKRTGIDLPAMYKLGYKNNNCIGCVKGGLGYWNKIRVDFPERFAEMAKIERDIGRTICKDRSGGRTKRVFLDELSPTVGSYHTEEEFQCGIFCQAAEEQFSA